MITEQVALSLIGFAQAATLGIIGIAALIVRAKLAKLEKPLNQVKHHVVNDHSTNMRDEADERHEQNSKTLASIQLAQANTERMQLEQGTALDRLLDLGAENRRRIIALEITEKINEHTAEIPKQDTRRYRRERIAYSPPDAESRRDSRYRGGTGDHWSGPTGNHP
jgi:hypothetical protein